jgi:uncharacterized phage-associated protein
MEDRTCNWTMAAELSSNQVISLLNVLVLRAADEGQYMMGRVRLTKLLYLAEIEFFRRTRRRLTDLHWLFYHYGPYVKTLEPAFRSLSYQEVDDPETGLRGWNVRPWETEDLDRIEERLPHRVAKVAEDVCRRWSLTPLGKLLDFVYFETEPMVEAVRGEGLRFETVEPSLPVVRSATRVSEQAKNRLAKVGSPFADADSVPVTSSATFPEPPEADIRESDLRAIARALNRR